MRYQSVGLQAWDKSRAAPGFTLLAPDHSTEVYLLGMRGEIVHEWHVPGKNGGHAILLPNGNLLVSEIADPTLKRGREQLRYVSEYDWGGKCVWKCDAWGQHHDFRRLPNGNTAYLGFERMSPEACQRVRGGMPGTEMEGGNILGDTIYELTPEGKVAWEWHAQSDLDIEKYALHGFNRREEFSHANAMFVLPNGDYLVSLRRSSWLLIIDRATRRVRWDMNDDRWGGQHDCQMLPNGHILFFANGFNAPGGGQPRSRILELDPESRKVVWSYEGAPPYTFFSFHISGCQRLWNGNTLICEGLWGRIFEVTPEGAIVWEYISPFFGYPWHADGLANWVYRALRYAPDSPEIAGRVRLSI